MNGGPTAGPGDKTWSLAKIMRTYLVSTPSQVAEVVSLTTVKAQCHGPVVLPFGRLETMPGVDNNDLAEYPGRYTRA